MVLINQKLDVKGLLSQRRLWSLRLKFILQHTGSKQKVVIGLRENDTVTSFCKFSCISLQSKERVMLKCLVIHKKHIRQTSYFYGNIC